MLSRCKWTGSDPVYIEYHDREWGMPVHDDRLLFEFLVLEGAQAGLSWITILKKRDSYRKAFDNFEPLSVANFKEPKILELMGNAGIVRNRLKIDSAINNAAAFLKVQDEFGSFSKYIWGFTNGKPIKNSWNSVSELPAKTALSDAISKDLKSRGFKFVGSTICYSFMQAIGMVNDHTTDCFRYSQIDSLWESGMNEILSDPSQTNQN